MQVPVYASYLYDAVRLYATALRQAVDQHIDVHDGAAILANIKGRIYESESNRSHSKLK